MESSGKSETIEALKVLGGIANLNQILDVIIKRGKLDLSRSKTPDRTLSKVLQENCLQTSYGKDNTFYSVYGIKARKGVCGLTDSIIEENKLELTSNDEDFVEGKKFLRKHICIERNKKLITMAKKQFKERHNGKLFCEICGFSFVDKYGDIGKDFIEAHHIKPVSEMKEGESTNINDIVMVCSNCHSMIHRRKPWLNKNEIRDIIKK